MFGQLDQEVRIGIVTGCRDRSLFLPNRINPLFRPAPRLARECPQLTPRLGQSSSFAASDGPRGDLGGWATTRDFWWIAGRKCFLKLTVQLVIKFPFFALFSRLFFLRHRATSILGPLTVRRYDPHSGKSMAPAGQALSSGGYPARSSAPLWLRGAFSSTAAKPRRATVRTMDVPISRRARSKVVLWRTLRRRGLQAWRAERSTRISRRTSNRSWSSLSRRFGWR